MKATSFMIRKPFSFLLIGSVILLGFFTGFLYKERKTIQEHNRQLIIQNDSIISVNILLADSLRQKPLGVFPKKSLVHKSGLKQ
jgi:hypothetical protein